MGSAIPSRVFSTAGGKAAVAVRQIPAIKAEVRRQTNKRRNFRDTQASDPADVRARMMMPGPCKEFKFLIVACKNSGSFQRIGAPAVLFGRAAIP
jgi:hypothetical protein